MLYCPQCGAEYREGYSSCSDCHVLLVRTPPQSKCRPEPGDPNRDPFTHFWRGDDSRLHVELCALLDEVEIPHMTIRKEDRLFRVSTQPYFELVIPASKMAKAESLIKEVFGEMPELPDPDARTERESNNESLDESGNFVRNWAKKGLLPALLEKLREPRPPVEEIHEESDKEPRKVPADWFSEDATVEVWSGPDETLAEMISISLRENDIPSRVDELKDSKLVYVQPGDESRAREIVREIVEGVPPE